MMYKNTSVSLKDEVNEYFYVKPIQFLKEFSPQLLIMSKWQRLPDSIE